MTYTTEEEDYWVEFGDCITRSAAKSLVILQKEEIAFDRVEGCVGKRGADWMVRLTLSATRKLNMGIGTEIKDIKTLHAVAKKWKKIGA